MTDTTLKNPVTSNFLPMAITGTTAASMGDQVGNAFADIFTWFVQLACKCIPPEAVTSGLHTLCVAGTVIVAFIIHYQVLKLKGE